MPTYRYECQSEDCEKYKQPVEQIVQIDERDLQYCHWCGGHYRRIMVFTGLTWAPTAGGYR